MNIIRRKARTAIAVYNSDTSMLMYILSLIIRNLPFDIGKFIKIKIKAHNFFIRLHSSSMSMAYMCNPMDRADDHAFITAYLKKNDIYIDVGANIGTTLIPAAISMQGTGKIIGFEPHPKIFSYLNENLSLNNLKNNNIILHNCALGSKREYVFFTSKKSDDTNKVCSQPCCKAGREKQVEVPVEVLDDFCMEYDRISLVKIDVEGYEKNVIEGGLETLKKTECIYFEVYEKFFTEFGYSVIELFALLSKIEFSFYIRKQDGIIELVDDASSLPKCCMNIFAIRDIESFIHRTGWLVQD